MPHLKRRDLFLASAVGGTAALTADDKPKDDKTQQKPFDQAGEKRRILEAGMTAAEADCWVAVADAAGKCFDLPKLHTMDDHEVAHAIHVIQNKLLGRPTYRKYLEIAKKTANKK